MITLLILIPAIAAIIAAMGDDKAQLAKRVAVAASLVCTIISGAMYLGLNLNGSLQFLEKVPWMPQVGVSYFVALDGISLPFVVLTSLLTMVSVLASWDMESKSFFALFLVMQSALTGVFASLDLILFFVFW